MVAIANQRSPPAHPPAEEEEEDFWEKLLASRYEEFAKENEEAMGKGRRTRSKLVRYSEVQQLEQEESVNVRELNHYRCE
jgi:hypothetical protein